MKKNVVMFGILFSSQVLAQITIHQLNDQDQKYYKNTNATGMNQIERMDSAVKEINKMYGQLETMKADIERLKAEVAELKKKKSDETTIKN